MASVPQSAFDPYHRWLGIRDKQRPPNHYRLLGLEPFEDDSDVIREAANRQLAYVRTFRVGPHKDICLHILDELTAARTTLLDSLLKSDYDRLLRAQLKRAAAVESSDSGIRKNGHAALPTVAAPVECTHCGHENSSDRKFCAGCGSALWEPCIDCGGQVSVAERHCGHCGSNLKVAVQRKTNEIKASFNEARRLRQEQKFREALTIFLEIAAITHPRLAEYKNTAEVAAEKVQNELSQYENHGEEALSTAQRYFYDADYEQAALVIEQVPEGFRSTEMRALLEETRARQIELLSLMAEIRDRVSSKQYDGLLDKVDRLLEIKPDHVQIQALKQKLLPLEQKRSEQKRDQSLKAAVARLSQQQYDEAVALLEQIPAELHTEQSRKLLEQTRTKAAEAAWLLRDLREAVVLDEHLQLVAKRLQTLKPADPQVTSLVQELREVLQASPAERAAHKGRWPSPPTSSYWGYPLNTIRSLRTIVWEKVKQPPLLENLGSFGVATGLALQGIGRSAVDINLVPEEKGYFSLIKKAARRRSFSSAWGIDIGRGALKAIKLVVEGDKVVAEAAEYIEHEKILNRGDVDPAPLLKATLEKFLAAHPPRDEAVCISIPNQRVLSRFFTLPMIETKKVPELMRYEVRQQIPFDLSEVTSDWQIIGDDGGNQIREHEIVLLAIKGDDLAPVTAPFTELGLRVDVIQCDTVALHNFFAREYLSKKQAASDSLEQVTEMTAVVDVGTETTNVLITNGEQFWMRSNPVGGNTFVKALVNDFSLSYQQAEQLKRKPTAAREMWRLYESLRPGFEQMVGHLERTLEYHHSLDRQKIVKQMFVVGGGAKLHGLQKVLWLGR